jgi:hypothetical protein
LLHQVGDLFELNVNSDAKRLTLGHILATPFMNMTDTYLQLFPVRMNANVNGTHHCCN